MKNYYSNKRIKELKKYAKYNKRSFNLRSCESSPFYKYSSIREYFDNSLSSLFSVDELDNCYYYIRFDLIVDRIINDYDIDNDKLSYQIKLFLLPQIDELAYTTTDDTLFYVDFEWIRDDNDYLYVKKCMLIKTKFKDSHYLIRKYHIGEYLELQDKYTDMIEELSDVPYIDGRHLCNANEKLKSQILSRASRPVYKITDFKSVPLYELMVSEFDNEVIINFVSPYYLKKRIMKKFKVDYADDDSKLLIRDILKCLRYYDCFDEKMGDYIVMPISFLTERDKKIAEELGCDYFYLIMLKRGESIYRFFNVN